MKIQIKELKNKPVVCLSNIDWRKTSLQKYLVTSSFPIWLNTFTLPIVDVIGSSCIGCRSMGDQTSLLAKKSRMSIKHFSFVRMSRDISLERCSLRIGDKIKNVLALGSLLYSLFTKALMFKCIQQQEITQCTNTTTNSV